MPAGPFLGRFSSYHVSNFKGKCGFYEPRLFEAKHPWFQGSYGAPEFARSNNANCTLFPSTASIRQFFTSF